MVIGKVVENVNIDKVGYDSQNTHMHNITQTLPQSLHTALMVTSQLSLAYWSRQVRSEMKQDL